jgi:hypothetical protein
VQIAVQTSEGPRFKAACSGVLDNASADLTSLLDRLKGAQHALIEDAARQPGLPSTAIIRKIAELENTIAAVWAFIEEREGSR